jgi:hypothetical protein
MKLIDIKETYVGKKNITQETLYIHGPTRWVNSVVKVDLPINVFRHDKDNLDKSLSRIVDSEVIALNLCVKDEFDVVLPLLYREKNQFSTELLICFNDYKYSDVLSTVFKEDKSFTVCKNQDELTSKIKLFFDYLKD